MFGYVKVFQPELKMKEFEQYRGIYCALCKNLRRRYGHIASWSLHYDFVFLAMFDMARTSECAGFHNGRCHYNPLRKRLCCKQNPSLDTAADAAVLLVYHKLCDNAQDEGFWGRLAAKTALLWWRRYYRRARQRQPALDQTVAACMQAQAAVQARRTDNVDEAADPSARMLAALAAHGEEGEQRALLERFGYCLGRWVYLIDALDDLEKDAQSGNYNPFLLRFAGQPLDRVRLQAQGSLNASRAACVQAFEGLTVHRFQNIIINVLEWGMPAAQQRAALPMSERKKARQ